MEITLVGTVVENVKTHCHQTMSSCGRRNNGHPEGVHVLIS